LRFYGGLYYYRGSQAPSPMAMGAPIPNQVDNDTYGFRGRAAAWVCPDAQATLGINTRADLAVAAGVLRDRRA